MNIFPLPKFTTKDFHLPYNPDLIDTAKEFRRNPTPAERKHFIVGFYCAALKLAIEIDGDGHFTEEGQVYDAERSQVLASYGLKVIRFTNDEVMNNFEDVCQKIGKEISLNPS